MNKEYPKYIDNRPIGEDQFEGKSHERIANSISDHIRNKNELRILGIEGEWGSGKSNIIELIKQRLVNTHYLYLYDCWGHQEDSHRRAFLEELTEELVLKEKLNNETEYQDIQGNITKITWAKKIKYLLARKRETDHKTIPKISIGIIVIGLVIILSPLFTLISETIFDENAIWWKKLILPLSPIILAIITYFLSSWKSKKLIDLSELFFLYKGTELENTTYEIFSDTEPSVKEFKQWIQSISNDLETGLVIVFDNMDRLPPEKVKGLWSSIHTFFAEHKYEKIHIIIPFDREHLGQAFDDQEPKTNEFINKTFSITYRVSPPVLTDWKDFFTQKFEDAFGDKEEDFPTVLSVFDRLKPKFTPRDIIVFINELVTYNSIWKEDIPLRYIAVFVLKKEFILDDPQKIILANDFLDTAKNLFVDDDELQNFVSALAYNVPLDKASQVILVRDLELILRGTSNFSINDLTTHKHFIEILEAVIFTTDIILDTTIPILADLNIQKIQGKGIKNRVTKIWDELTAKQCSIDLKNLIFGDNYKSLLINASTGSKKKLVSYLIIGYRNVEKLTGKDFYNCNSELEAFIAEQSLKINLDDYLENQRVTPEVFLDYYNTAKSNYKKYKLTANPTEFDSFLSGKISDDLESDPEFTDFSFLRKDYPLDSTKNEIESQITANSITIGNFSKILSIYKSISAEKPLDKKISIDNLYTLLQNSDQENENYYDIIAIRLSYAIEYYQQIKPKGWVDNTSSILQSTDEEIVKKIASEIEFYTTYGSLLVSTTTWDQPLLNAVCKELTINNVGVSRLSLLTVLPVFEDLINTIDIEDDVLLKRLNDWNSQVDDNITVVNLKEVIPEYTFYNYTTSISLKITEKINKIVREFINSIEEEEAIKEWSDEDSYFYNSLKIMMESGKIKSMPRNIFNSIKQLLKNISESRLAIPENDTMWSFFMEQSKKNEIAPTIRSIRDYFINNDNITPNIFLFFKNFLEKYGKMNENPGNVTRTILGKVISNNECFNHILSKQDFYVPIINNANEDAADLKDNVFQRITNSPENDEVRSLAERIGVEFNLSKEEES